MPRGLRKRGRRHKDNVAEEFTHEQAEQVHYDGPEEDNFELSHDQPNPSGPSWIIPAASRSDAEDVNPEAPFGFVDAEVKAYFRTVDVQIREWQDGQAEVEGVDGNVDIDPNEGTLIRLSSCWEVLMGIY